MLEKIRKYRQDLHRIPELELNLPKTYTYIRKQLLQLDCTLFEPIPYSLLAYFDNNKEKTIAFRSDMDALPVQEKTDAPYQSLHQNCMHACGHDGHMAILLGFAQELNSFYKELNVNVLLIFQPGEESPGGARLLCETKFIEKFNVNEIYATHLWPNLEKGQIATKIGPMMARSSEVNIDIFGKTSHAAKYTEGVDALEIGCHYLCDIYAMEKKIAQEIPRLLRFGVIQSGTVRNVVSDHCRLEGTLRALDDKTYWHLRNELTSISNKYPQAKFQFDINEGYPVVYNNPQLVESIVSISPDILLLKDHEMISEDFSWYLQEIPGVFFFLGTGTHIPLHNAKFDFDESILMNAINLYIKICKYKK